MSQRNLKFFMREEKEEIVKMPAPKSFVDDKGQPIDLEIKVLNHTRIQDIFSKYRTRSIATNEQKSPYLSPNGEVVFKTERDSARAVRHIIAEALVYPPLQDSELMKFYNCVDITEMPTKVFSKSDEYTHVNKMVMQALGLGPEQAQTDAALIEEAKN